MAKSVVEIDNVSHYPITDCDGVLPFYTNHSDAEGFLTVIDERQVELDIASIEWSPNSRSTDKMLSNHEVKEYLRLVLASKALMINGVWLVAEIGNNGRSYYLYRKLGEEVIVRMNVHLKQEPQAVI